MVKCENCNGRGVVHDNVGDADMMCPVCNGKGVKKSEKDKLCSRCHGTGTVRTYHGEIKCVLCYGKGAINNS